ncbi:hypothetical protein ABT297_40465 [Dactylosporangium sp. NPDC000555]|uniref:hypothetical protein n=1 Tax=Dactylosporangium sp. NPDC000555 TaxID=3154260 RepID=UPI003328FE18
MVAPVKKTSAAKKATPPKRATPTKQATSAKKATPAKKATSAKRATPVKMADAADGTEARVVAKKAAAKKAGAVKKGTAVTNVTPPVFEGVVAATGPEPEPIVAVAVPPINDDQISAEPVSAKPDKMNESPEVAGNAGFHEGAVNPAFLSEVLALAAVERLGGKARRRVEWYRVSYPDADGDAVSRAITREFVQRARWQGFAGGLAGSAGLVVEAAGRGWLQAELVLHLAAAYGHDPEDRRRAAELLVLQRVHGTVETAEASVDGAPTNLWAGAARRTAPLARVVGAGIVRVATARLARRVVPGAGAVVGYVTAARSTEQLAARAVRFYRNTRG